MISPQQEVFTLCRRQAVELYGKDIVYDYTPFDTPVPFIIIGEAFNQDIDSKSQINVRLQQTIHFYHPVKYRGTLEKQMLDYKRAIREIKHTKRFYITVENISSRVIQDNSTDTPLLHGILEIEFYIE